MSDVGVRLRDMGMRFTVSPASERSFQSLFRVFRSRAPVRHVNALRDVSLEIGRGERVGLIGPNGAGKSTLLKIMGRIYSPTSGAALVSGHVCPLFEFATGNPFWGILFGAVGLYCAYQFFIAFDDANRDGED